MGVFSWSGPLRKLTYSWELWKAWLEMCWYFLCAVVLLATIGQSSAGPTRTNMNKKLTGRVIHVESLRRIPTDWRGHWLNGGSKWLSVKGNPERTIYYQSWSQFNVKSCDGGTVCLESLSSRDRYIDAHWSGWAKVTETNYPNNKKWAQWNIECEDGKLSVCRFFAVRWGGQNKYLDAHHSAWVGVSRLGKWSNFRILAPKPAEYLKFVKGITNYNRSPVTYTVKYTVGIENTHEVTNTVTTEVGVEVATAFVTASASLSHRWQETKTSTFTASKEFSLEIPVQPFTRVKVKQLAGNYGPFNVYSKHYEISCYDLKMRKRCINTPKAK